MPICASAPQRSAAPSAADAGDIPADAVPDLVVLAVKPQVIRDVTAAYKRFGDGRTTFVSIAAGTPVATFEADPGQSRANRALHAQHARCHRQGHDGGVFQPAGFRRRPSVSSPTCLSASGEVATIDDEGLMDAVTAVSGSGPAYIFHFIEA